MVVRFRKFECLLLPTAAREFKRETPVFVNVSEGKSAS